MRRLLLLAGLILFFTIPVSATEFTAPKVPEHVEDLLPKEPQSFMEGLDHLLREMVSLIEPSLTEAASVCLSLIAVVLLLCLLQSVHSHVKRSVSVAGSVAIGILLLDASNSMIHLGVETVRELSAYGKLLVPVMTAAMAAQGSAGTSAALYTGTVFFDAIAGNVIEKIIVPMIFIYLALAVAASAIGEDLLKKIQSFVKWVMTWSLKTLLYVFTGYMGITGVVTGSADAAAVKAAKLTISGVVPVVGGILSDASEAVLISAGIMKNAAGVYGILALLALTAEPFIKIGVQYLMLKLTGAVCAVFGNKEQIHLISDFSASMGLLLAMTGTESLLLLISTVCFMRGAG